MRRDGTLFPVELSLARWSVGEASFYSGIIRDISERRAADQRLREALRELEARRAVIDVDLHEASAFQRAMLPAMAEVRALAPTVAVYACYEPAEVVGGDLYDVAAAPGGGLRVFLADTVGHGVQASLRTMVVKTIYERHESVAATPAALLARVNADAVAMHPDRQMRLSACCFDLLPGSSGARRRPAARRPHAARVRAHRSWMTIFPRVRPDSTRRCASAMSASGSTASTTGVTAPD